MPSPTPPPILRSALAATRTVWILRIILICLLLGQYSFIALFVLMQSQSTAPPPRPAPLVTNISFASFPILIPLAFCLRHIIFHHYRTNGLIRLPAYCTATLLFWAACILVCWFSLVVALINGNLWPTVLVTLAAMAAQPLAFPRFKHIQAPPSPSSS